MNKSPVRIDFKKVYPAPLDHKKDYYFKWDSMESLYPVKLDHIRLLEQLESNRTQIDRLKTCLARRTELESPCKPVKSAKKWDAIENEAKSQIIAHTQKHKAFLQDYELRYGHPARKALECYIRRTLSCDYDLKFCIPISVDGISGSVQLGGFTSVRGKWASHTGYHSYSEAFLGLPDTYQALIEIAQQYANTSFDKNAKYPFLVGDEHKEHGWKSICLDDDNRIRIRLPDWHNYTVANYLHEIGMRLDCPHNNYWVFPEGAIDLKQAKLALAPLLKKGSRLTDETVLLEELKRSVQTVGIPGVTDWFEADCSNTESNKKRQQNIIPSNNQPLMSVRQNEELQLALF